MAKFIQAVRVWQSDTGTESEDILVNLDLVTTARVKPYFDSAEGQLVDGTELVFVDERRILLADSLDQLTKKAITR